MPDFQEEGRRVWAEMLDRCERELVSARILTEGQALSLEVRWDLPDHTPPLPEALVAQVQAVLVEQAAVLQQLKVTRALVRRQLRYLNAHAEKGLASGPRFIDQRA